MHTGKRSKSTKWLNVLALVLAASAVSAVAWKNSQPRSQAILVNACCDPSDELFRDLNPGFVKAYEADAGFHVAVQESEKDSDVVALPFPSDVDTLQRRGLVASGWAERLPNRAQPFSSTIVFLVRKGNPKSIRDWPDLVRKEITVAASDPKTSDTGKLGVLAAWGAVVRRGGSESDATDYLGRLYARTPVSSAAFTKNGVGDILVTWENEALSLSAASRGDLEIVYPPVSILVEPVVAWVDSTVARHHSEDSAKAYLQFLFTAPAQEIIAKHGYRPADPAVLKKYAKQFRAIDLFPVTAIARDWDDAALKFFADDGIFCKALEGSRPVLTARK
jgi:sulfate transport system substrate-binding protein